MMRAAVLAALAIASMVPASWRDIAWAQHVELPGGPSDNSPPPDIIYPDAVLCSVLSPEAITYRIVFYKSQTISFAHELNNVAEYGTTFIRDPDKFDAAVVYKWRLQLGKPGNITLFAVPSGWSTDNCPVGKSIDDLRASKQTLKLFVTQ